MVNKAIEEMVCEQFGEPTWEAIRRRAGVDVEVFISNEGYPDSTTYDLVAAASEILGLPADQILEAFGEYWLLNTGRQGYGALLEAGGRSLVEFLTNLPNFHTRVSLILPNLVPPDFRVSDVMTDSLHLHYYSHRPGLAPFVVGLTKGLGELFGTPVQVSLLGNRDQGADHDTFLVRWTATPIT